MSKSNVTAVTGRFIGGGLFEPRKQEEGKEAKYSACVVLDAGEAAKIDSIIKKAIAEKWGTKKPSGLQIWGVRDGDDPDYAESYEHEFINPKSVRGPHKLVKRNGHFIKVTQDDDLLYPGCYVAVSVSAYGYAGDKAKGIKPGVSLNLRAILFRKHGDRLGDQVDTDDEFPGFESESDELDFLAA